MKDKPKGCCRPHIDSAILKNVLARAYTTGTRCGPRTLCGVFEWTVTTMLIVRDGGKFNLREA